MVMMTGICWRGGLQLWELARGQTFVSPLSPYEFCPFTRNGPLTKYEQLTFIEHLTTRQPHCQHFTHMNFN